MSSTSTFSSIELGRRSLLAHKQSTQTAGHNISNSSTPGYTRQRVNLEAFEPLYRPDLSRANTPGQIGQGVSINSITRLRDELLDTRIVNNTDEMGFWQTRDYYMRKLENVHNEPEDISVRSRMDQFWEAWQELSLYPESDAARQVVRTRSETLTDSIHHQHRALQEIRDMVHSDIEATVKQINDITGRIADLNNEIVKSKAMGDNPNDVMDKRDVLVEKLAKLFFDIHDFTQVNRQGPDVGEQYRSEIFYANAEQKKIAAELVEKLEKKGYKVATKISKADKFYEAEDYHQDYYEHKGTLPYCHVKRNVFSR